LIGTTLHHQVWINELFARAIENCADADIFKRIGALNQNIARLKP